MRGKVPKRKYPDLVGKEADSEPANPKDKEKSNLKDDPSDVSHQYTSMFICLPENGSIIA